MTAKTEKTETVTEYVVNGIKLNDNTKIKFIANPKRDGSKAHERYKKYESAKTFGEYMTLNDKKYAMADARHDIQKEFLKIS